MGGVRQLVQPRNRVVSAEANALAARLVVAAKATSVRRIEDAEPPPFRDLEKRRKLGRSVVGRLDRKPVRVLDPEDRDGGKAGDDRPFRLLARRLVRLAQFPRDRPENVQRPRALVDAPADLLPLTKAASV